MSLYPVLLLSGGLGLRMRPYTNNMPKALIPIFGKPFLVHQIELLRDKGVTNIVISTGYKSEMIDQCLDLYSPSLKNLSITTIPDGDSLLGTAGAIRNSLCELPETFFVMYGDCYLDTDFKQIQSAFLSRTKPVMMTIFKTSQPYHVGNVFYGNSYAVPTYDPVTRYAKYGDYGVLVMNATIMTTQPAKHYNNLQNLLSSLGSNLDMYVVSEEPHEIGSQQGLSETISYLASKYPQYVQH